MHFVEVPAFNPGTETVLATAFQLGPHGTCGPFWTGLGRIGMWVAAFGAMGRDEAADKTPVRLTIFIFAAEYHLLGRLLQVVGATE